MCERSPTFKKKVKIQSVQGIIILKVHWLCRILPQFLRSSTQCHFLFVWQTRRKMFSAYHSYKNVFLRMPLLAPPPSPPQSSSVSRMGFLPHPGIYILYVGCALCRKCSSLKYPRGPLRHFTFMPNYVRPQWSLPHPSIVKTLSPHFHSLDHTFHPWHLLLSDLLFNFLIYQAYCLPSASLSPLHIH